MRRPAAWRWRWLLVSGLVTMACSSSKTLVDASPPPSDGHSEPIPDLLFPDRAPATDSSPADLADSRDAVEAPPDAGHAEPPWDGALAETAPDAGAPEMPADARPAEAGPAEVLMDARGDAAGDSSVDSRADTTTDAGIDVVVKLDGGWPGGAEVSNASTKNAFGVNLSGLTYQPAGSGGTAAILWAVQNDPSKVFRLTWNGTAFTPVSSDGWGNGKELTYPNGSGRPDSEALTRTEWDKTELYVASERNTDAGNTSRMSILRYDLAGTGTTLTATNEWNLTPDLPAAEPNLGLEAIAWIPDSFLVERGFYDEHTKATYSPAAYANHGTGIFLVGVEGTGMVYGYALDHAAGTFQRVAAFSSGQSGVMDLAFDRDTGTLWSQCDAVCDNRMTLLDIDTVAASATQGRFVVRATLKPPAALSNLNDEGITLAPESECANGQKSFFWADDDESNGYAIRRGTIPCGRLF